MKILKIILASLLPMALVIAMEGGVAAFHNGGVGPCEGCHTMHNSSQGSPVTGSPIMNAYLLRQQDPSSTCLTCHQGAGDVGPTRYHISTPINELLPGMPPKQLTPGGDFGWLNTTYSWIADAASPLSFSQGERHGHNIVAADYLYDADSANTTAPGGAYPANRLGCISCHDPHGTYRRNPDGSITTTGRPIAASGSFASSPNPDSSLAVGAYRMLGGQNYRPKSLISGLAFVNDPPAAVAPDQPNRSEAVTQTRVAYGAGMSEWCRNCHPNMHTAAFPGPTNLLHPSGAVAKLGTAKADSYGAYIKTGELTGLWDTSYLSLVPYEEGTADYTTLKAHARTDDSVLVGPDRTTAQVMCLSCHRAHASGWDGMTRWNARTDFIVYNGKYAQDGQVYQPYGQGRTEAIASRAYYDRPVGKFALDQDTLCNKCHAGVYP